jgi:hypothetical protein
MHRRFGLGVAVTFLFSVHVFFLAFYIPKSVFPFAFGISYCMPAMKLTCCGSQQAEVGSYRNLAI